MLQRSPAFTLAPVPVPAARISLRLRPIQISMPSEPLPVESVLPQLAETLATSSRAILVAPPGAGKSTRVPLALLQAGWLGGQRVLLLEPRRIAARAVARFMAQSLGEGVGQTVGYRMRGESRVGPHTRVEVVTEGVLTRLIQADPALEGVGLVIFDEFHERSLHADLGLALTAQVQELLRSDLRLLVMSATIDAERVADLLGGVPVIESHGRMHPVTTHYLEAPVGGPIEPAMAQSIQKALRAHPGDLLAFLPGVGEIRRTAERLASLEPSIDVLPLHGALPPAEQDRALRPSPLGCRKVVLATPIAQTSLTVQGVQVVIDGGYTRAPRYSPRTGMARLETVRVSIAAADQRRGRAGRLGPGVCYRLWTEAEHRHLLPADRPEILEADLTALALELAAWGVCDAQELKWLDPPPAAAYAQAVVLLKHLKALDSQGRITERGRRSLELGAHPRLAHMLLQATPLGLGDLACELAALLGERDLFRGDDARNSDIRLRVEALRGAGPGSHLRVESSVVHRLRSDVRQLQHALGLRQTDTPSDVDHSGLLLAFAYPDRIAKRRGTRDYLLQNGRGATLAHGAELGPEPSPYCVAAALDDRGPASRILLAAPIAQSDLTQHFADSLQTEDEIGWDPQAQAVRARRRTRLGAIIMEEVPVPRPDPQKVYEALLAGIRSEGLAILPWTQSARSLRQRLQFMHHWDPSWPDVSDEALLDTLEAWLGPFLHGMARRTELQRVSLAQALLALLPWEHRAALDELVPTHWVVPSGSRIRIDYSEPEAPVLAVRLQEMFGLQQTPRIAGERVPVTLQLLSPAGRPVQVTQDLAGFWRDTYFDVRKDLRGRYPKHSWPDDPLQATPTSRTRRER